MLTIIRIFFLSILCALPIFATWCFMPVATSFSTKMIVGIILFSSQILFSFLLYMHIKIIENNDTEKQRQKVIEDARKRSALEMFEIASKARQHAEQDRKEFQAAFVTLIATLFTTKGTSSDSPEDDTRSQ